MQLIPGMWVSVLDVYKIGGDISQMDIPFEEIQHGPRTSLPQTDSFVYVHGYPG